MISSLTIENVIKSFELLQSADSEIKESANQFLMGLVDHEQVWELAKAMINEQNRSNYQFLGAQLLYQKIERDLHDLTVEKLASIREFIFGQLDNNQLNFAAIAKLASAGALVGCALFLTHWPTMVNDLLIFMNKSLPHLKTGLLVLERIPEELRQTNRIKHSIKNQIQDKLLQKQAILQNIFEFVFRLNDEAVTRTLLETIESWIRLGFPLMNYSSLLTIIIQIGLLYDKRYYDSTIKIICESLQITAQKKFQTLAEIAFQKQRESFSQNQINSLLVVIQYINSSKQDFYRSLAKMQDAQQLEIYCLLIKELLLSYGFLLLEDIGMELVLIMVKTLESNDLKLSFSTFQFWIDFSEKIGKAAVPSNIDERFWNIVYSLFEIILKKTALPDESMLMEVLKEEETIDDMSSVSFQEYRKQAQHLIKFIYDYFTRKKEAEGSNLFFSKLMFFIQADAASHRPGRGLELAIYAVKASLDSMMREYDTANVAKFIDYVTIEAQALGQALPPRVAAQFMNLLKDCCKEAKQNGELYFRCLTFCLNYIQDDALCHYAVYGFHALMEMVGDFSTPNLVDSLIAFYHSKEFNKQIVLEKILEGILNCITKLTDKQKIAYYFKRILGQLQSKYQVIVGSSTTPNPNAYFISLIEIKTLLNSYQNFEENSKLTFKPQFLRLANQSILIIHNIIGDKINRRVKFCQSSQLGMSISVCKNALKVCEGCQLDEVNIEGYIALMDQAISILNPTDIELFFDYSFLLEIIGKVLSQFTGSAVALIDKWLQLALPHINSFFMGYVRSIKLFKAIDPDFIKWYYLIQQSLLLYNQQIYLNQNQHKDILNLAILSIRNLNQKGMQRKVINFILLCIQKKQFYSENFPSMLQTLYATIPIIHSLCYLNLGRIFILLMEGTTLKAKENLCRQLLQFQPYKEIDQNIKEIMGRLMAFVIESKVERYIKGVLLDLTQITWKKTGMEMAMQLQLRYATWKREYAKSLKANNMMN